MPKILIVEDDTDLQFVYDAMLSRHGYEAVQAENIVDALTWLTTDTFDLVILDMNMPDLPGIRVLEFAQDDARLKNIPVVVISANEHWRAKVLKLGVHRFIVKPITMHELIDVVDEALATPQP